MKRRRFLQLFGLSPAAVVLPVPAREPDLLPAATEKELWQIEPAADAPIWSTMVTATCRIPVTFYCRDPYGTSPCKLGAENCVCQQRMIRKEYVT